MTGWNRLSVLVLAASMVAGAASGCAGTTEDVGAAGSALHGSGLPPMAQAAPGVLDATPAGCEGRLALAFDFDVVSLTDGLIAARDERGSYLCVDTLEAVEAELGACDREGVADQIHARFVETLFEGLGGDTYIEPTTRIQTGGFANGDPTPQPNTNPDTGNPDGSGANSSGTNSSGTNSSGSSSSSSGGGRSGIANGDPTPQPNTQPRGEGPEDFDGRDHMGEGTRAQGGI